MEMEEGVKRDSREGNPLEKEEVGRRVLKEMEGKLWEMELVGKCKTRPGNSIGEVGGRKVYDQYRQ